MQGILVILNATKNGFMKSNNINFHNADCMEFMKQVPDKFYSLALVDPPYGLGTKTTDGGSKKNSQTKFMNDIRRSNWDNSIPKKEYFYELKRVSKNQIIWGGNYMAEHLGNTKCIIIWDKMTYIPTMSQFEFAFCSMNKHPQLIKINSNDVNRQHPTQKPVALYEWLLSKYAKPNDKIFDSHGGSGSIAIAVDKANTLDKTNYSLDIIELDKDYFDASLNRFKQYKSQTTLF
jgi:site-specific DNA-methyltransferase (adenine-specific)